MFDHKQSVKEVIRHVLFRTGLSGMLNPLRRWRGQYTRHIGKQDLGDIFSQIYSNDAWVMKQEQESLSGLGSTRAATEALVVHLSAYLREIDCRKLVDIGCGDFNWMRNVEGDFDYLGIDIVPQVIANNNSLYANDKRRFVCMDATRTPLEPGDVALCREVLFHLSFQHGQRLLSNIKAAGFKHILLTSDTAIWFNSDIRNGDFRRINLSKSPYRFPSPSLELTDDKVSHGRVLAVWTNEALPG